MAVLFGMLLGLPVMGVVMAGKPVHPYLEFPPLTRYVTHPPFSWVHFIGLAIFLGVFIILLMHRGAKSFRVGGCVVNSPGAGKFPWWGYASITGGIVFWVLAWSRFSWFSFLQPHTFTPLWLSYIFTVNALTLKRSGRCMLTSRRGYFLLLFPASTLFWWFFEYLNRFVQNWHYLGGRNFTPVAYVIYASISFSTVLPAVLGTRDLLMTIPFVKRSFSLFIPVKPSRPKTLAVLALFLSAGGLTLIGIYPEYTYSLIWISPMAIIVSIKTIFGESHVLSHIKDGDWTLVIASALAALLCGVFWEMWNFYSLSKWVYSVPYVHRFLIFEMPVLGFAGYLPFGLQCAEAGSMVEYGLRGKGEEGT